MSRVGGCTLLAVAAVAGLAWASPAEASEVDLQISPRRVQVGRTFRVQVVVTDGAAAAVPDVSAPSGIVLEYSGQSSSFQVFNGAANQAVSYAYMATGTRPGSFTLGPVSVTLADGTVKRTETVEVTVLPRPEELGEPVRVESGFGTSLAWEGQVLVYRHALASSTRAVQVDWTLPPMDGFVAPRHGQGQRAEYIEAAEAGKTYFDETRLPLVAAATGTVDLPGAIARAKVRSTQQRGGRRGGLFPIFAEVTNEVAVGETARLTVRPLPAVPSGRVFSGLVGDFQVEGAMPRSQAAVGDSVAWRVTVEGDGSLEGLKLPTWGDVPGIQVYDDAPEIDAALRQDAYWTHGVLTRVLVPTEAGVVTVPDIDLVTYSPTQAKYVVHTLPGGTLTVNPGTEGEGQIESFGVAAQGSEGRVEAVAEVEEPIDDPAAIRPIRRGGAAGLGPLSRTWGVVMPLLLLGAALPGAALTALVGGVWARKRARTWSTSRAAAKARPARPLDRLRVLPEEPGARLAVLADALRAAHIDVEAHGVSPSPRELELLHELTRELDRARFAGIAPGEDVVARVRALLLDLDEHIGRTT